jgi:hypothetical protein
MRYLVAGDGLQSSAGTNEQAGGGPVSSGWAVSDSGAIARGTVVRTAGELRYSRGSGSGS